MRSRDIKSKLIYIHIAEGLGDYSEDYFCKTAKNINEAVQLIEQGFEYVTEMAGAKLFRKRK